MRQAHTHAILPPTLLNTVVLPAYSPSSPVTPSIANFPAGLAHDARNILAAMNIYCELLKAPGVLYPAHRHLADELVLLRDSSSSLIDRMLVQATQAMSSESPALLPLYARSPFVEAQPASATAEIEEAAQYPFANDQSSRKRVGNVADELEASHKMLAALAGPRVHLDLCIAEAPAGELMIASADFTRVLINLVRNAAEAMGAGGRVVIAARTASEEPGRGPSVLLSVEDNGPGIPLSLLDRIFDLSSSTAPSSEHARRRMSFRPRGLGLRIVRELVEGGGGNIRAARLPERGSRFEIVLPMVTKVRSIS